MDKKNKAAKAINTALGLIVIFAVILASPLFGYARGFASAEQRQASMTQADTPVENTQSRIAATPRPTPLPTPTPVVLPSAPPTPDPTPVPTPAPIRFTDVQQTTQTVQQPVQQTAQQPAQQTWQQPEWDGGGIEEDAGAADAGNEDYGDEYLDSGLGEQPVWTNTGGMLVETGNADIVIQTNGDNGGVYQPPDSTSDYTQIQRDSSEGEVLVLE